MSKKIKLPKRYWVKGKSKFLGPRLFEEGMSSKADLVRQYDKRDFRRGLLAIPSNWFKRFILLIKQFFCQHQFGVNKYSSGTGIKCVKCGKAQFVEYEKVNMFKNSDKLL